MLVTEKRKHIGIRFGEYKYYNMDKTVEINFQRVSEDVLIA